jgi:hypothetical protein
LLGLLISEPWHLPPGCAIIAAPEPDRREVTMAKEVSRRAFFGILGAVGVGLGGVRLARAAAMSFDVKLSGAEQVPPVMTKGSGVAHLTYDPASRKLTWNVTYENLSSEVTMAHFHGPAGAGKNAGVKLWLSKKGSAVTGPITGEATLSEADAKELMAGEWYINVHTKDHPGGEIRGQVVPGGM